jgi:regulator of cell morphogenesis and NO signaling
MVMTDFQKTVEQWVDEVPETLLILAKLNLDFAQVRAKTMDSVCQDHGLDPYFITVKVKEFRDKSRLLDDAILKTYDIPRLIGYVIVNHHHYMDEELPRLEKDLDAALREDGGEFPELFPLQLKVARFLKTFRTHMAGEETHFFPYFAMVASDTASVALDPKGLEELTLVVEKEDAYLVEDLEAIREATRWYHIPRTASDSYRSLMNRLRQLEVDLRHHMRVEDEILFAKVLALETEAIGGSDKPHQRDTDPPREEGKEHVTP